MGASNTFDFGVSDDFLNERCDLILKKVRVKESNRIYKTTSWAENDISIHHQLKRIQNLAVALKKRGNIEPGDVVFIVGASFSGLYMAAILAQHFKVIVHIVEMSERPMGQFLDASDRFIGPTLNTFHATDHERSFKFYARWYESETLEETEELFKFQAGFANTVSRKWIQDYLTVTADKPVFLHLNCELEKYEVTGETIKVSYIDRKEYNCIKPEFNVILKNGQKYFPSETERNKLISDYYDLNYDLYGGCQEFECDHLFFCTGFGKEKIDSSMSPSDFNRVSYFRSGNERDYNSIPDGGRVLLSGTGDSSVIELGHLLYKNFSHEVFYSALQFPKAGIGEGRGVENKNSPFLNYHNRITGDKNPRERNYDLKSFYDYAYTKIGSFQNYQKKEPPIRIAINKFLESETSEYTPRSSQGHQQYEFPVHNLMQRIEWILEDNSCERSSDIWFQPWTELPPRVRSLFWYSQFNLNDYILEKHIENIAITRHFRIIERLFDKHLYFEERAIRVFLTGQSERLNYRKLSDLNKVVLAYFLRKRNVMYVPMLKDDGSYSKVLTRHGFKKDDDVFVTKPDLVDEQNYRLDMFEKGGFNDDLSEEVLCSDLSESFNDILYDLDVSPTHTSRIEFSEAYFKSEELNLDPIGYLPNPGYAQAIEYRRVNRELKQVFKALFSGNEEAYPDIPS